MKSFWPWPIHAGTWGNNMARILIADAIGKSGVALLKAQGFDVVIQPDITPEQLLLDSSQYDALIVRSRTKITKEVILAAKNLKIIARSGSGVDTIDVSVAKEKNIVVVNAPGANSESVAEHTIALMLAMTRNLVFAVTTTRSGLWKKSEFRGIELKGKTLGIVGFGSIGQRVAELASIFSMQIFVHTRSHTPQHEKALAVYGGKFASLDELIAQSDIISLHAPLTDETRGMFGEKQFKGMKNSSLFINTARGGLVDEKALVDALANHAIASAALDVFATEPVESNNPLLTLPNIILTPHVGASSAEAEERASMMVSQDVVSVLQGKEPLHAVK